MTNIFLANLHTLENTHHGRGPVHPVPGVQLNIVAASILYQQERAEFLASIEGKFRNFTNLQVNVKMHVLFTLEPRLFAKFVVRILEKRQTSLYGPV